VKRKTKKAKRKAVVTRLPAAELRKLAVDLRAGQVFTSAHVPADQQDALPMVFMPIALGGLRQLTKKELDDVGLIYEYLDKAGPRAINGFPSFFSMHFLNKDDARQLGAIIKKLGAAEQAALQEVPDA
jgi:hypothetical protein